MRTLIGMVALVLLVGCERPTASSNPPIMTDGNDAGVTKDARLPAVPRRPTPPVVEVVIDAGRPDVSRVLADGPLRIESESDGASSEIHVLMRGEAPVRLPDTIERALEQSVTPLALHGAVVVYDRADAVLTYQVDEDKAHEALSLPSNLDVLEYGRLAPDGRTIAVIYRVEQADPQISFVSVGGDGAAAVLSTVTPDPAPLIRCASRCYVSKASFESSTKFSYLVSGGPEDPVNPDAAPVMKTVPVSSR